MKRKLLSFLVILFLIASLSTVFQFVPTVNATQYNFGYETIGSGEYSIENYVRGSEFTITEAGTADNITVALKSAVGGTFTGKFKCAIYNSDNSLVLNGVTEERTLTLTATVTWYTFNFVVTKPSLIVNQAYILVAWTQYLTGYAYMVKDTGDTNQGHYDSAAYNSFPDPLVPTHNDYKYSIYCTYTPSGAPAEERSFTFTETMKPSATLYQWQEQTRSFTETVTLTTVLNQWQEHCYVFQQTITPTESITYWQEHGYVLIETIAPTDVLNLWQEQILTFIETAKPVSALYHWIEGAYLFFEYTFTEPITPSAILNYSIERATVAWLAVAILILICGGILGVLFIRRRLTSN